MNLDANVQKILSVLLKKWKMLVAFGLIGVFVAYFLTANFTDLTYSSKVEFLAYAIDSQQEFSDSTVAAQQASNTSKMNYAMKMMDTYIEVFKTNSFNQQVAEDLNKNFNSSYSGSFIKSCVTYQKIENTAMFTVTVTTTDPDLSYQIAHQLETGIPDAMKDTNSGLVTADVQDPAIKATTSQSREYPKKCLIGFAVGIVIAAAYLVLRELLDVRIKTTDELVEKYDIPVLGAIPDFEIRASAKQPKSRKGDEKNG